MNVSFKNGRSGETDDLIISFENPCGAIHNNYSMKIKFTINNSSFTKIASDFPFKNFDLPGYPCNVNFNLSQQTNAQCIGDDKEIWLKNIFPDNLDQKQNTLILSDVYVPKHADSVTIEIYDDETSTTQPIVIGTQYGMDLEIPILQKESLNNTVSSLTEINLDFNLNSLVALKVYGDIDIELGSTLPQSGKVFYTVTDTSTGK